MPHRLIPIFLILSGFISSASKQDHTMPRALPLPHIEQLQIFTPSWHKSVPYNFTELPCVNTEKRLSYRGYEHCRLHPEYQHAFAKWDCHCYTGQCRPTRFKRVRQSAANELGLEIEVNGTFFSVPKEAFRNEKADMTTPLLEWDAHVCSSDPPNPHIECAWIDVQS